MSETLYAKEEEAKKRQKALQDSNYVREYESVVT